MPGQPDGEPVFPVPGAELPTKDQLPDKRLLPNRAVPPDLEPEAD